MKKSSKSALSTTVAVILTAVIVGSVVGGATSYIFMSSTDSTVQEVRADVKAVADAIGVPVDKPDELKKLMDERKLIEAARQEGKLVVYTQPAGTGLLNLRSAFERKYPQITVEFVTGTAAEVTNRFVSDYAKGTKAADVIVLGQAALFDILQKPESLAKYMPKDTEWLSADLKDKDGRWVSPSTVIWTIGYNTKLVPKADAPKSYRDLLDAKWAGKIGAVDPKTTISDAPTWKAMEKLFGEDFIRQLAAQRIKYYTGAEALNKLAAGEISIFMNGGILALESRKIAGGPVDWVRMSDNTYLSQLAWYGISANALHPNAAKLWIDFVFSKEGQQISADGGNIVNMPGLRVSNPDLTIQGKKLIQLERISEAERADFLKAFSAKYDLGFP